MARRPAPKKGRRPPVRGTDPRDGSKAKRSAKKGGERRATGARTSGAARPAPSRSTGRPSRRNAGSNRAPAGGDQRRSPTRGLGGGQVEGRQAVRELLLAGTRKVRELWLSTEQDPAPVLEDIVTLARELRVPTREVSRARLDVAARTDAPQGVVARAAPLPEADLDDLARGGHEPHGPFLLCSDGITDPGNLGALLRSAECAGVTGVVLPRHRAVRVTPTVAKAAAGAIEHLPMAMVGGMPAALRRLSELGVVAIGLDETAEQTLWDLDLGSGPVALVLGGEGSGLGRLAQQRCERVVAIPMRGRLGSLNVATAGALACFEIARRRS